MSSVRKRVWAAPSGDSKSAWLVDYRDSGGKRRSKQFARKKDAEAWVTHATYQVSQGTHTPDSLSSTVGKAAQQWLDRARREDLEPTTIAAYGQHVRLHIEPLCGGVKLSQLSAPMVEGYRDKLVEKLSRPMAIRVLRSFTSIIAEAQRRGQVAQNVAQAVRVKRSSRQTQKVRIAPKNVLKALLMVAQTSRDRRAAPLVMLTIFAGLRASELRGLSWRQLDFKCATVTIDQRADATGKIGAPKSLAGHRTVPLPDSALKALKEWKLACGPTDLDWYSHRLERR